MASLTALAPPKQAQSAFTHLNREPASEQFNRQWDLQLSKSRYQAVTGPGRPAAREDYALFHSPM